MGKKKGFSYREAGVDIEAAERAVERIKDAAASTFGPRVLCGLGGFGGLFEADFSQYRHPVLVAGCDGVGTKLKIAFLTAVHNTVGIDCVAMCVNDVLAQGAEPLFFLDYLAVGSINPSQVEEIVSGIAEGCRQAGCSLIGGETAEMPGFYRVGEYDLAGFAVGVVEKEHLVVGSGIAPGDRVIGLPSSGLHANGFSLARRVLLEHARLRLDQVPEGLECSLGEELLRPTKIYVSLLLPLFREGLVKGAAHITGGGLLGNIPRVLPRGLGVELKRGSWQVPPIFGYIAAQEAVNEQEMYRTFNMGLGMVLITSEEKARRILESPPLVKEGAREVGRVVVDPQEKVRLV